MYLHISQCSRLGKLKCMLMHALLDNCKHPSTKFQVACTMLQVSTCTWMLVYHCQLHRTLLQQSQLIVDVTVTESNCCHNYNWTLLQLDSREYYVVYVYSKVKFNIMLQFDLFPKNLLKGRCMWFRYAICIRQSHLLIPAKLQVKKNPFKAASQSSFYCSYTDCWPKLKVTIT